MGWGLVVAVTALRVFCIDCFCVLFTGVMVYMLVLSARS